MNQEQIATRQLVSETVGGELYEYYPLGEYIELALAFFSAILRLTSAIGMVGSPFALILIASINNCR